MAKMKSKDAHGWKLYKEDLVHVELLQGDLHKRGCSEEQLGHIPAPHVLRLR